MLESEASHPVASGRQENLFGLGIFMTAPRILLADDQEEMLRTIVLVLGNEFDIVGTAQNGQRAIELARTLSPDVLVLDISMPVVNGIEAALCLKELGFSARVIFLTVHEDPDFVEAAQSAGALGYVLKDSLSTDLVPAIGAVMRGDIFTSPSMQLGHLRAPSLPH
jgi:DNA-binding NarL/FixJ family response regulator